MLKASIDIGSNSILLLVAEVNEGKLYEKRSEARITGLGKNLDQSQEFNEQAMNDSFAVLEEYREIVREYGLTPEEATVTATEAMRVARNAPQFCREVKQRIGFDIVLISGEGEAYYTGLGVTGTHAELDRQEVIMDIGGASTELLKVETSPYQLHHTCSLPIGSVRGTDFISTGIFEEKVDAIFRDSDLSSYTTPRLYCVAGTMTSLAAMIKGHKTFEESAVDGLEITFSELGHFYERIKKKASNDLNNEYPYLGKRAKTIVGGCRVAKVFCEKLKTESLIISKSGLRYGTLMAGDIHERFRK